MFWMWIRIIKSGLAQSVKRLFDKTPGRRFRPQWFFSAFFLLLLFSFIIVILNYCKVDYKMFIIRNNKLTYLPRMKSCFWGCSCYHYSLAQRPISHRIHMFLATLSIICKCGILGIGCVSIWCARSVGFYSRRARPTEVFKLVLSLGAQITPTGTYACTQASARTYSLLPWHSNKNKSRCTVTAHTK